MRRFHFNWTLLLAAIGLSTSAFTLGSNKSSIKSYSLAWYSSVAGSPACFVDHNTVAAEIMRLEGTFGGTYNTVATGGLFVEEGFVVGGSEYPGSDPEITIYLHL